MHSASHFRSKAVNEGSPPLNLVKGVKKTQGSNSKQDVSSNAMAIGKTVEISRIIASMMMAPYSNSSETMVDQLPRRAPAPARNAAWKNLLTLDLST
jgi:hypothetical protein